jgi:hypothetical protein
MQVYGQLHTPAALWAQKNPNADCTGASLDHTVGLHMVVKRKISIPPRNQTLVVQFIEPSHYTEQSWLPDKT